MKRLLCAAAFGTLLASSAHAGSLYSQTPAAYNWTGFYIGLNGGFGGDSFDYPFNLGGTTGKLNLTSSGFFGGGQLGYNWQVAPNWLVGVETDISGSGIKGNASASTGGLSLSAGSTVNYFGTLRGRLGWVNGPFLLYGTGGFAYGDTESSVSVTGLGAPVTLSKTNSHTGWTIGAGVEYALTSRITLKTEYKWVDLGTKNLISVPGASLSEHTKFHSILFGANYRF